MNIKRTTVLACIALPALVAADALRDDLTYSPAKGTSVTKSYTRTSEISLDEMEMMMGGQDVGAMMGDMQMNMTNTVEVSVTDEYLAMGDGRPTKLKRTFDGLNTATDISTEIPMMGEPMETSMSGSSELEGLSVVFEWSEDDGEYSVAFADDSDGDEELLEDLSEALDFRAFLPGKEVSADDEWSIDPNAVRPAFAPGGSLKMTPEADGDAEGMPMGGMSGQQPQMDQMLDEFEGEISATYAGMREEDGTRVAVIKLVIDVESANDMSEFAEEMMSEMEFPGMDIEMDIEAFDIEYRFEGEGVLLWNPSTGLPFSLEISGESTMITDQNINMVMQGQEQAMEQSMTMGGTETVVIEFN